MYISGNGEVYDDEEIYSTVNRRNADDCNEADDCYDFQEIEDVINRWEQRLHR